MEKMVASKISIPNSAFWKNKNVLLTGHSGFKGTWMSIILNSFYSIINRIFNNQELPSSKEKWERKPYTRKELDELCIITPEMSLKEIEKRIKSTTYKKPWAYTEIKGKKFYISEE